MKKVFIRKNEHGFYLIYAALAVVSVIILSGLAIDGSHLFLAKLRLQRVVDASALSAINLRETKPNNYVEGATKQLVSDSIDRLGYSLYEPVFAECDDRGITVTAKINVPIFVMNILPGLGEVTAVEATANAGVPPMILELVLDNSSSMLLTVECSGDPSGKCVKLDLLKQAAISFVDALDGTGRDYLGITVFSSMAWSSPLYLPLGPLTPTAKANAKTVINLLSGSGATCISCGMEKGLKDIKSLISTTSFPLAPQKYMVLFTDGAPNVYNDGSLGAPAAFRECWSREKSKDAANQPLLGLYSGDFNTTNLHNLPPTNQVTNASDAAVIWQTINSANHLAKEKVTTYTIALTDNTWMDAFVTGCNDTSADSPCPNYLLNVGSPYVANQADGTWVYNGAPGLVNKYLFSFHYLVNGQTVYNPYPNTNLYTHQLNPSSTPVPNQPFPDSHPLFGICPLTPPGVETDPFQICYHEHKPFMLRRVANDPEMNTGPDPIFPYRSDAPPTDISSSSFCAANPNAWECRYWQECEHLVGPEYPQGAHHDTPDPSELPQIFHKVLADIRNKSRLLP